MSPSNDDMLRLRQEYQDAANDSLNNLNELLKLGLITQKAYDDITTTRGLSPTQSASTAKSSSKINKTVIVSAVIISVLLLVAFYFEGAFD